MSIKTEFALLVNGKVIVVGGEALKEMLDYGTAVLPTGRVVCINNKVFPLYKLYGEQSLGDWFKEEIIDKSLGTLKEDKHMTNEELAKKCKNAGGCYKCRQEVKNECLKNECWKSKNIKERMCPAVKYGEIPRQAVFASVWDGGKVVESDCFVNLKTKEITEIEMVDVDDSLDVLDGEYIVIGNVRFDVLPESECYEGYTGYWYRD